ncbi:MAG: EF-P lysine aminoacylase GenX [Desulfobulbus sp.]|nr:MAG: EF-P lysine aminoacylase GenX [Desulfobulbus sp.]
MLSPQGLRQRSDLFQAVRDFFRSRSYIEVDTPIRQPVILPEAEIVPVSSGNWFLQTSPELYMKRLLADGNSRVFQICHCFRQGERGRLHLEEFSMLEWYHTGWSYLELMAECEELICAVMERQSCVRCEKDISLVRPWIRLSVEEAFQQFCGLSASLAVEQGLFDELLVEKIEPELGWKRPVFLYDYPVALASLAREKPDAPDLAERFELYIGGVEIANGFSELTDPDVQRQRFTEELVKINETNRLQEMPEIFLKALRDVPDCAGIALGLDRLLMICTGADSIVDVVPFVENNL